MELGRNDLRLSAGRLQSILLGTATLLGVPCCAAAAVNTPLPDQPRIIFSTSADYPDMVFIVYAVKVDDPWATGHRVDATTAWMIRPDTEILWSFHDRVAILAVPRTLADQTEKPDPAWLSLSPTVVVRVPQAFLPEPAYRPIALHYELRKTNNGPILSLLNPEELKAAQQYPVDTSVRATNDIHSEPSESPLRQAFLGALLALAGLLVGSFMTYWLVRKGKTVA